MTLMKDKAISDKLDKIRQLMKNVGADYYYVPSTDPHQSEYVPKAWQRRQWLSGFTGSAGDVIIGHNTAYLWTDGRYAVQAKQELDPALFKLIITSKATDIYDWLGEYAKQKIVAVDPKLISIEKTLQFKKILNHVGGKLVPFIENFVDMANSSPSPLPQNPIMLYGKAYSGQTTTYKLKQLRLAMKRAHCQTHIISQLDNIAWLFNIRGGDIPYNPVVISYAIITETTATLYIDLEKIPQNIQTELQTEGILLKTYSAFGSALSTVNNTVMIDKYTCSWWIQRQLAQAKLQFEPSAVTLLKAQKHPIEIKGMKDAHKRDGVAVIQFLHWLESNWKKGVDELSAAKKLYQFRQENALFKGLSFGTISGFAENSAIIHYQPSKKSNKTIDNSSLFLVDSGGQYLDGTTDITRTVHLGKPTDEQKKQYTLVLKGHLALRNAIFQKGTFGENLDILARQFLWQAGLNYPHGTGHGVGHYLCVHEGPQCISEGTTRVALTPGMVVSNEPGVYFPGQYGIRIENLCTVVPADIKKEDHNAPDDFYTFQDLTAVPYAKNLIDISLLTPLEIKQINQYHKLVLRRTIDELPANVKPWLEKATAPLKR